MSTVYYQSRPGTPQKPFVVKSVNITWMHQWNLPTLHYWGILAVLFSLFPFHIFYLHARFDAAWHIRHRIKGNILLLASCLQQSKRQTDLSINPINLAKMTAGPEHSVCITVYLPVFRTSLSAFSLRRHWDWQRPIQTYIIPVSHFRRNCKAQKEPKNIRQPQSAAQTQADWLTLDK